MCCNCLFGLQCMMPMHGTKSWELLMDRATLAFSVLRVGYHVETAVPLQHGSVLLQWTDWDMSKAKEPL